MLEADVRPSITSHARGRHHASVRLSHLCQKLKASTTSVKTQAPQDTAANKGKEGASTEVEVGAYRPTVTGSHAGSPTQGVNVGDQLC